MGNSTSSSSLNSSPRKPVKADDASRRRISRSVRVPPTSTRTSPAKNGVKPTLSSQLSGGVQNGADEFRKTKSMYELRKSSTTLQHQGSMRLLTPQTPVDLEPSENDAGAALMSSRFATTSIYPSMCRQKSFRRADPAHPLTASGREIVRTCFENPHIDLGNRICSRVFEKRPDYQKFVNGIGRDKWPLLCNNLQNYLEEVVASVDNLEQVQRLSRRYGEEHVSLKSFGFKPDFWVTLADATTVECVILDMASHQPTDTVHAWSQFVSVMFSAIRDGYYTALRAQRMSTRKSLKRQESASAPTPTADGVENTGNRSPNGFDRSPDASMKDAPLLIEQVVPRKISISNGFARVDRPIFE